MPNRWSWAVAAVLQLLFMLPAHASACDAAISRIANFPGMSVASEDTLPTEDGELAHFQFIYSVDMKAHLQIECARSGPPYAVLMNVYDAMLPPRSYLETLAKLGSILTRVPSERMEAELVECYDSARAAEDHNATFKRDGITFDCDVVLSDKGPSTVTIAGPPAEQ